MSEENRISIDPEICHGKPCIKGTRIPVYLILEMLEHGLSFKEILEEYPHITVDDIKACIKFAKALINNEEINLIVNTGVSS
ncbi:MAG: DUF433 domain-containing protein [Candidatus Helarchaeota archaeon]